MADWIAANWPDKLLLGIDGCLLIFTGLLKPDESF
jgi:hypothetical protein